MNAHDPQDGASSKRVVQIFKNGRSRAIRIPKEFDFAGDSVVMRKQPDGSILVKTAETAGLVGYLKTAEPWAGGSFAPDDEDLLPLDDVDLS